MKRRRGRRRRRTLSHSQILFFSKFSGGGGKLISLGRQAPGPLGGRPSLRARPALARDPPRSGDARRPRHSRLCPLDHGLLPRFRREARVRFRFDGAPSRGPCASRGGRRVVRAEGRKRRGEGGEGEEERRRRRRSSVVVDVGVEFSFPFSFSLFFGLALSDQPPRHLGLAVPDDRQRSRPVHRGRRVRRVLEARRESGARLARSGLQPARLRGLPAPLRLLPGAHHLQDATLHRRAEGTCTVRQDRHGQHGCPRGTAGPVAPATLEASDDRGRGRWFFDPPRRVLRGLADG